VTGDPATANDGQITVNGKASLWHSRSNTGQPEWWQVDLARPYAIKGIEICFALIKIKSIAAITSLCSARTPRTLNSGRARTARRLTLYR
jgi:hypothetical protein